MLKTQPGLKLPGLASSAAAPPLNSKAADKSGAIDVQGIALKSLESLEKTCNEVASELRAQKPPSWRPTPGQSLPTSLSSKSARMHCRRDSFADQFQNRLLRRERVEFWVGTAAAIMAFGFVMFSATETVRQKHLSVVPLLPGFVTGAVALLFFRQLSKTTATLTSIYIYNEASQYADSIKDETRADSVKARIALNLVELNGPPSDPPKQHDR
jgi:hypothetical protein